MKQRQFVPNIYTRFLVKTNTHDFDQNKCWEWKGSSKGNGYGSFSFNRKNTPAHRMSYMLFISKDIPKGFDICHTCDNRMCVNPDHLFLGTRKDNMQDMKSKRRGKKPLSERKHLSESQVQEIKKRLFCGHSARKISISMGIECSRISSIKRGATYNG